MDISDKNCVIVERAGDMVSVVSYAMASRSDPPAVRAAKAKISSEARQKLNRKASWQKLEALLHCNFSRRDLFVTLTYRDGDLPGTREGAQRALNRFLDQLRQARAVRGQALRYVKATERLRDDGTEGRWHHHLVINATGNDYEELRSLWARWGDNVDIEALGRPRNFTARAQYLCKECQPNGARTWSCSQGLKRPVRTRKLVDAILRPFAPPGAEVLEQFAKENAWGSFVYFKYILPDRAPPDD